MRKEQTLNRVRSTNNAVALTGLACCLLACGCESHLKTPAATAAPIAKPPAAPAVADSGVVPAAAAPEDSHGGVDVKILDYDGIQRLVAGHRGKVVVMD